MYKISKNEYNVIYSMYTTFQRIYIILYIQCTLFF